MSCDSGVGLSEESQNNEQKSTTAEDGDHFGERFRRFQPKCETHVPETATGIEAEVTPVQSEKGSAQLGQVARSFQLARENI